MHCYTSQNYHAVDCIKAWPLLAMIVLYTSELQGSYPVGAMDKNSSIDVQLCFDSVYEMRAQAEVALAPYCGKSKVDICKIENKIG